MAIQVSFILINYFSEKLTTRCVESIYKQTKGVSFEVMILDNHSGMKADRFKREGVRVFMSSSNLGFGTGCETLARQAQGQYLYFLNNDSELLNDAATILTQFLENNSEAGMAGGQLVDNHDKRVCSFDYFPTLSSKIIGTGILRRLYPRGFPSKDVIYEQPVKVDLVSGANLFISKSLYRATGGFDPQFFLYCEEEDLARRVHLLRKKVFFVPEARIRHQGGGSSKESQRLKKEFYISYFKFYHKHYGSLRTFLIQMLTFRQFLWRSIRGPEKSTWRPILWWFLRGSPERDSLRYEPGNLDGPPSEDRGVESGKREKKKSDDKKQK